MMYKACNLCARSCLADRESGELGFCRMGALPTVARAALHRWEEPIISGSRGSGTIFFSGCSLGCLFCQNRDISSGGAGIFLTEERLSEIMLELQEKGAHNINFVTPTHFAPSIKKSVALARAAGLSVPIVYNTGTYDTPDTVKQLADTVDIYLPDFKYWKPSTAEALSFAENYPDVARTAIDEMVRQKGAPRVEKNLMKSGVIVRLLLLPGHLAEAKLTVKYLLESYGDDIYISLMNQYTPMKGMKPPLDRPVTHAEYYELCDYAVKKGLKNGFTQDFGTAKESFIPPFDNTGVLKK